MSTHCFDLNWIGPFRMDTAEGLAAVEPPSAPGVYLWTINTKGGELIAYVGEASDMEARFRQHVSCTLGGEYELYSRECLQSGRLASPDPARGETLYKPAKPGRGSARHLLDDFVARFEELSILALENLKSYRFYFAETGDMERPERQLIESRLIQQARDHKDPLQNARTSRNPDAGDSVKVSSSFDGSPPPALI